MQEVGKVAARQGKRRQTEREAPEFKKSKGNDLGPWTKPTEDIQMVRKLRLRLIFRILVEFA